MIISFKNNRYWLYDSFLIYRVSSYYDDNFNTKCYKIITSYCSDTDDPDNTDIYRFDETELDKDDIIILDRLTNKKRKNKRINNNYSYNLNFCNKKNKKISAIGKFINKLTDIANFRF